MGQGSTILPATFCGFLASKFNMMMKMRITSFFAFVISNLLLLNPCFTEAVDEKSNAPVGRIEAQNVKDVRGKEGSFFFGYLNLVGTVLISEKDRNLNKAIYADAFTRKRVTYQEGSLLPYGVKLKRVEKNCVILEKEGQKMILFLGTKNNYFRDIKTLRRHGYRQIARNEWVVNSHYLFKSSEDMIKLAVDSGLAMKKSGKYSGVEIANNPNKKMTGLGFQKGDMVIDINGTSIDGPLELDSAYKNMRNSENVTIKVLRNGKPVDLNYWVAKKGFPRYNMRKILDSEKIKKMLSM